jgi:hypothetical protein
MSVFARALSAAACLLAFLILSTLDAKAQDSEPWFARFGNDTDRAERTTRARSTSGTRQRSASNRGRGQQRSTGSRRAFSGGSASTGTGCLPPVLKTRLAQIESRFGPVRVVSTHRPGARIRGTSRQSYHASCRAVDFIPPSGKKGEVLRWLYANHEGGVGNYTCMAHLHIDNGPFVRYTKCR